MPEHVRITDVSPRDGLQNEPGAISTADKLALVAALCECGLDEVEVSSFVSSKWIPQLGDAPALFALLDSYLKSRPATAKTPLFSALVPNEQGLNGALAVNNTAGRPLIGKVSVFTAASETFAQKNTNATIAQTIDRFKPVVASAHDNNLLVRGYVSCVIACPFEGPIDPAAVATVAQQLVDIGVDELDFGDTIGAATPTTTRDLLIKTSQSIGNQWVFAGNRFTLHLHDTFGQAAACAIEALNLGVRSFDASVAGLGGCPYASTPGNRAPGNIATETLVNTIRNHGFATSVDSAALHAAAAIARTIVSASGNQQQAPPAS